MKQFVFIDIIYDIIYNIFFVIAMILRYLSKFRNEKCIIQCKRYISNAIPWKNNKILFNVRKQYILVNMLPIHKFVIHKILSNTET